MSVLEVICYIFDCGASARWSVLATGGNHDPLHHDELIRNSHPVCDEHLLLALNHCRDVNPLDITHVVPLVEVTWAG